MANSEANEVSGKDLRFARESSCGRNSLRVFRVETLSSLCRRANDSLRFRVPKVLAEHRLECPTAESGNTVAKELSRAFCEQIEGDRLRLANKWNFCGANSEKSFPPCPRGDCYNGCGAQRQRSERHFGSAYLLKSRLLVFFFRSHSNHVGALPWLAFPSKCGTLAPSFATTI